MDSLRRRYLIDKQFLKKQQACRQKFQSLLQECWISKMGKDLSNVCQSYLIPKVSKNKYYCMSIFRKSRFYHANRQDFRVHRYMLYDFSKLDDLRFKYKLVAHYLTIFFLSDYKYIFGKSECFILLNLENVMGEMIVETL